MKREFVEGLSNYEALLAGRRVLSTRGALESSWLVAEGEAGYGKTRSLMRFAMDEGAIFLRAKAKWTVNWFMRELAEVLAERQIDVDVPSLQTKVLYGALVKACMKLGKPIIIDEADHAVRHIELLESIRDISDAAGCEVILGGMPGCMKRLMRYKQIRSRIAEVVYFGPLSLDDVGLLVKTMSDVSIAKDLVARIHTDSGGRLRDVLNAIARIETKNRNARGAVTSEMWGSKPLTSEHREPVLRVVAHG